MALSVDEIVHLLSTRGQAQYGREAVSQLDTRLMATQKPLRVGSLVVFARGADLAGRVTEAKMREVLSETKHLLFAIGVKDAPGFSASQ